MILGSRSFRQIRVLGKLRLPLGRVSKEPGLLRIPLGERHLRKAVKEYAEHYHVERNHQGLDNELIERLIDSPRMNAAIERRERLGRILNYYHRRAA